MAEKPIIFSAPMVLALLCGRKTVTRRIVNGCIDKAKPPCAPGDILWVREAWRTVSSLNNTPPSSMPKSSPIEYMAETKKIFTFPESRIRSPLHMPHWASRINILVTDVRMERLHEITYLDCLREGVIGYVHQPCKGSEALREYLASDDHRRSVIDSYSCIWNEIHGNGAWANNPHVWRIEFEVSNEKAL